MTQLETISKLLLAFQRLKQKNLRHQDLHLAYQEIIDLEILLPKDLRQQFNPFLLGRHHGKSYWEQPGFDKFHAALLKTYNDMTNVSTPSIAINVSGNNNQIIGQNTTVYETPVKHVIEAIRSLPEVKENDKLMNLLASNVNVSTIDSCLEIAVNPITTKLFETLKMLLGF